MPLASATGPRLTVNELEVMLVHLAGSKVAWRQLARTGRAPPPYTPGSGYYGRCLEVRGLGYMNASCGETCTARAPTFTSFGVPGAVRKATGLTRHRVQSKWAGHIKYATRPEEVRLRVGACER